MTRRVINYYRPRIQVPVSTMSDHPDTYALYCLPVDGAEALLRICNYLRRRVTYIGGYINAQMFHGPTDAEMETIIDVVGETEVGLMAGANCDDIIAELAAIRACVCAQSSAVQSERSTMPDMSPYISEGKATFDGPEQTRGSPAVPATDAEKCELAQTFYAYIYQAYTEYLLPYASEAADTITAGILATSAFSALAGFVGIPIAMLGGVVASVVNWGLEGSIANFTNWLTASKEDLVCAAYNALPSFDAAAQAIGAYIDLASELSYLDKLVLKQMYASSWWLEWVAEDQQDNGTFDAYIISGYCSVCPAPSTTCANIDACYLPDWDGGMVGCYSGRARVIGGLSYYTKNTLVMPAFPIQLTLHWYPRATDHPTAKCRAYIREVGNYTNFQNLGSTGDKNIDVYTESTFTPDNAWATKTVEIGIAQETWHCEPVKFCAATI